MVGTARVERARELERLKRILAEEAELYEKAAAAEEKVLSRAALRTERTDSNFLMRLKAAEESDDAKRESKSFSFGRPSADASLRSRPQAQDALAGLGVSAAVPTGSHQAEDEAAARKLLARHDKDGSGTIDEAEFAKLYSELYLQEQILRRAGGSATTALGQRESDAELKKLFRRLDQSGNGQLKAPELIAVHSTIRSHIASAARQADDKAAQAIFRTYDKDRSGAIDFSEFAAAICKEHGMEKLNEKASHAELKALFAQIDRDGSGSLNLREFNLGLQVRRLRRASTLAVCARAMRVNARARARAHVRVRVRVRAHTRARLRVRVYVHHVVRTRAWASLVNVHVLLHCVCHGGAARWLLVAAMQTRPGLSHRPSGGGAPRSSTP